MAASTRASIGRRVTEIGCGRVKLAEFVSAGLVLEIVDDRKKRSGPDRIRWFAKV
jgi:hypothetical protein